METEEPYGHGCYIENGKVYDVITNAEIPDYRILKITTNKHTYCFDILSLYRYYLTHRKYVNFYTNRRLDDIYVEYIESKIKNILFTVEILLIQYPVGILKYVTAFDKNENIDKPLWKILLETITTTDIDVNDIIINNINISLDNVSYDFNNLYKENIIETIPFNKMTFNIKPTNGYFINNVRLWLSLNIGIDIVSAVNYAAHFNELLENFKNELILHNNDNFLNTLKELPNNGTNYIYYDNFNIVYYCTENNLYYVIIDFLMAIYNMELEKNFYIFFNSYLKFLIQHNYSYFISYIYESEFANDIKYILTYNNFELFKYALIGDYENETKYYLKYILKDYIHLISEYLYFLAQDAIISNNVDLLKVLISGGTLNNRKDDLIKYAIDNKSTNIISEALDVYKNYIINNNNIKNYANSKGINIVELL